jgi:hypothetical protein
METVAAGLVAASITLDPQHSSEYGTDPASFRLWVDYLYDLFGATADRGLRRLLVSLGFGCTLWLLNLLIALPFGLADLYVRSAGTYIISAFIALVLYGLRWISQEYHVRTNAARPCFPIPDDQYKMVAVRVAKSASNNIRIVVATVPLLAIVWAYLVIVAFYANSIGSSLLLGFPKTFEERVWLTGEALLPKLLVLALYSGSCMFVLSTGLCTIIATLPLYFRLSRFAVVPVPAAITELFRGVLNLYLVAIALFTSGVVMLELLYNAQLDSLTVGFDALAVVLSIIGYLVPRQAVRRIWLKSRREATLLALQKFYAMRLQSSMDIAELNELVKSVSTPDGSQINLLEVLKLLGGQVLPFIVLAGKAFVSQHLGV